MPSTVGGALIYVSHIFIPLCGGGEAINISDSLFR